MTRRFDSMTTAGLLLLGLSVAGCSEDSHAIAGPGVELDEAVLPDFRPCAYVVLTDRRADQEPILPEGCRGEEGGANDPNSPR